LSRAEWFKLHQIIHDEYYWLRRNKLGKEDAAKKGLVDSIWDFFASVRLAVIVFSAISLTSVVGTIIEQQADSANNIKLLVNIFGVSLGHKVYTALAFMGFTDMFSAWWFFALLFLFAMNLVVCSIERFPGTWKLVRERITPVSKAAFDSAAPGRSVVVKAKPEDAGRLVCEALKKTGFRGSVTTTDGTIQVIAEKGRYSRLGVYVTHLSILMILVGAVVGLKFGVGGALKLLEGTSSTVAFSNNGREFPLGFEIRCDDFEVSFYPESERPKDYKSVLTVLEDGREILKQEVGVNSPLTYKGFTFYQSTYGFFPNKEALFKFHVTSISGTPVDVSAKFGQSFDVAGTKMSVRIADFSPALAVNEKGDLFTFAEAMINPAAFVEIYEGGKMRSRQWILKNYPETWRTAAGVIEFRDLWGSQYTGLQVRKDPGVWIVYLGCLVMAIGLCTAFFVSHARIWIMVSADKDKSKLTIAASINKNRIAFDRKLDRLVEELRKIKG
jgi:cytochrome c biogenesis protein